MNLYDPKNVVATIDDVPMNFGYQHGDFIDVGCQQIKKQWWSIDDAKNKLTPVKGATWVSMETQDGKIISACFYDGSDTLKILSNLEPSFLSPFSYKK